VTLVSLFAREIDYSSWIVSGRRFDSLSFSVSIAFAAVLQDLQLLLRSQIGWVEVVEPEINNNFQVFVEFSRLIFGDSILNKFDIDIRLLFLQRNLHSHVLMHHVITMLVGHTWLNARICEANFYVERLLDHIVLANIKAKGLHAILDGDPS
jgi:hypothetical protein